MYHFSTHHLINHEVSHLMYNYYSCHTIHHLSLLLWLEERKPQLTQKLSNPLCYVLVSALNNPHLILFVDGSFLKTELRLFNAAHVFLPKFLIESQLLCKIIPGSQGYARKFKIIGPIIIQLADMPVMYYRELEMLRK